MKVPAPWTHEQVEALNVWQGERGMVHPFTCPTCPPADTSWYWT